MTKDPSLSLSLSPWKINFSQCSWYTRERQVRASQKFSFRMDSLWALIWSTTVTRRSFWSFLRRSCCGMYRPNRKGRGLKNNQLCLYMTSFEDKQLTSLWRCWQITTFCQEKYHEMWCYQTSLMLRCYQTSFKRSSIFGSICRYIPSDRISPVTWKPEFIDPLSRRAWLFSRENPGKWA